MKIWLFAFFSQQTFISTKMAQSFNIVCDDGSSQIFDLGHLGGLVQDCLAKQGSWLGALRLRDAVRAAGHWGAGEWQDHVLQRRQAIPQLCWTVRAQENIGLNACALALTNERKQGSPHLRFIWSRRMFRLHCFRCKRG